MTGTTASLVVATLAQSMRMAVPYTCAGLGGVWSERSGVPNIALEGMLLAGAFAGAVADAQTGSPWSGVAAGALVGAAMGGLLAVLVVRGGVDAIIAGVALNLAASGGTRFALRALYDSSSNSPVLGGFRLPSLGGAQAGALLARTLVDPLAITALGLTAWSVWAMAGTAFGLRVRASGEGPQAARGAGVPVERVQIAAVSLGGAMAGLGGVALAYDQHQFQSGMSAGRGFIALAAVVLSGWRPAGTAAACFAFALLDALQIVVQDQTRAAGYLVQMLPYLATLIALAAIARRRGLRGAGLQAPAGLGKTSGTGV